MASFCFETLIAADQIQPEDQFPFEFAETYLKELNEKISSAEAPGKYLVAASEISEYGFYSLFDRSDAEKESLMDFKVVMRDSEYYKCNRILLQSHSEYFKNFFNVPGNETKDETNIDNIPYEIMLPILDYIHYGTLYLKPRNAYKILIASNFLKITSICDACINFYTSHQKRDYSKDTEDIVGYTESRSCSPYCVNDFYHITQTLLDYKKYCTERISPFVNDNFGIIINPVYAKYYNEDFVSRFIFNPEVRSWIPNNNVYAAFFFEWIWEQKKVGYVVPPETAAKFAACIKWRDVSAWIRKAANSKRLEGLLAPDLAHAIESGDVPGTPIDHEVKREFKFWNCELVVPDSTNSIDFMLPGHRDAISELFHVLMCFPNLVTIKPRERFCKAYSSDTGSCCPDSDFWYPDQWEEFFDNLEKYPSTVLKTIDFKGTFFYEGWDFQRQTNYSSNNPTIQIEMSN